MIGLSRREKEQFIVDLYNNGSSYREIAKEARISLRDIKGILDKANGVQSLSKSSQAYQMFSEGRSPTDVAIALDMREPDVTQLFKESWTLRQIYDLYSIYLETKGDLGSFVHLYMLSRESGLNVESVVRILRLADNDLPRLECKYINLRSEVDSLEAKKEGLIRITQEYDNQVTALGKSFDNYCQLCQEEELKLTSLQKDRLKVESLVAQFQENDREYLRIRNVVEKEVYSALSNVAIMLKLAVTSVIQSIKRNPEKYTSLINDNFLPANYNISSFPNQNSRYAIHDYQVMLEYDSANIFDNLANNLTEEILSKFYAFESRSSLPSL